MTKMRFSDQNPLPDTRTTKATLVSILGAALIVGGGSLAAGMVSHRPDPVKPATGTAQALSLASEKPAAVQKAR